MARWPLLFAFVVGCAGENEDGIEGGGDASVGDDDGSTGSASVTADDDADDDDATVDGDASADDDATATEGVTDPTDGDTSSDSIGDDSSSTGTGGGGPLCDGFVWQATMDANPTTLDENGDQVSDWEFSGGAFPAAQLSDGVWQAEPDGYLRTLPDNPLSSRVIVHVRMRAMTVASRGAVFWANLGQEDASVTRIWVEIALGDDDTQSAFVGGYSAAGEPEFLLDVHELGTDFIDVVLDADPAVNEVTVTIEGNDHGTLQLPSYDGTTPQAAAVGALEADVEVDEITFELCPP